MKNSIFILFFFLSLFGANEAFAQCPTKIYVDVNITEMVDIVTDNNEVIYSSYGISKGFFTLGSSSREQNKSKCNTTTKYSLRTDPSECFNRCYQYGYSNYESCKKTCTDNSTKALAKSKSEFEANKSSTTGYVSFD